MKLSTLNHKLSTLLIVAGACFARNEAVAGQNSSLSDLDIEFAEAKLTLQSVSDENAALREQLMLAQQQVRSLSESLGLANSEAEVFKREAMDLKLRMEALGLEGASADKSKLEQRLLKAVSDLKIVQEEKDKVSEALVRLTEALVRFLKGAVTADGDARMAIETEMRNANEALGVASPEAMEAGAVPSTLTDGMVISVKDEFGLIVVNLGTRHGVRIGMPFQVWRGDREIGSVRVVDVRDRICRRGGSISKFDEREGAGGRPLKGGRRVERAKILEAVNNASNIDIQVCAHLGLQGPGSDA